jgi:hypothetical protein
MCFVGKIDKLSEIVDYLVFMLFAVLLELGLQGAKPAGSCEGSEGIYGRIATCVWACN